MHESVVGKCGERCCHANAVVGAECGAVGAEPFSVDDSGDGLVFEVEVLVVGLAYHIHVCLHGDNGSVFVTNSCRFAHKHVADGVGLDFNIVLLCEIKKIFADFTFFFRWARNMVDFVEDRENACRLEVFDCHSFPI